jgi:hypothetical protein
METCHDEFRKIKLSSAVFLDRIRELIYELEFSQLWSEMPNTTSQCTSFLELC